jgi:hypothetical protein
MNEDVWVDVQILCDAAKRCHADAMLAEIADDGVE